MLLNPEKFNVFKQRSSPIRLKSLKEEKQKKNPSHLGLGYSQFCRLSDFFVFMIYYS